LRVGNILHALPKSFGFADLPDSVDGTVEFGVRPAHTDNLEFSTDDIEWMGE
jgi:hypothetical protein